MQLNDCKMTELLPTWMRDEPDVCALASVVDAVIMDAAARAPNLSIWNRIEQLPEELLDELALALNIEWWDSGADIEVKRSLIRNSDLVHSKKGTPAAVENVIISYFASGRLMEWSEYSGSPGHFKIFTDNPQLVADNQTRFLALLEKVKRKSSRLDGILIGLTGETQLYAGAAVRNHDRMVQKIGDDNLFFVTDVAIVQKDNICVRITAGVSRGE